MNNNFFPAVAVMMGYIIGVGMFSLPFLASQAGLVSFFILLIVLTLVQHFVHSIYASVILETKDYHRMPGYARIYLGKNGGRIVFLAKMLGNLGSLLAYIIITGIFVHQIFNPIFGGGEFFYGSVVFFLGALVVFFGIGAIAKVELLMSAFLFLVIILVSVRSFGLIEISNYSAIDWKYFLLPYGAMLVALDGNGSLPLVAKLVNKDKKTMKQVLYTAILASSVVVAVFTLVVLGVTGSATTPDALGGLKGFLNGDVAILALVFGVIAIFTSFISVSEAVRETLSWDMGLDRHTSWAIAVFVPYLFYILGFKDLIGVISFIGAVAGGISALALISIFIVLKRKKKRKLVLFKYHPNNILLTLIIIMFIVGMFYELFLHY